ncbi:hypothetical protein CLV31_103318 [Algoriphagus aquaeductus]|uniref:Uncharacterized protein n=1 Tax=Algoriphagus aquaeductus TaxID=475299 RepID=A0A326S6S0_9BACT|nr:hypothetical protein CLV31_103318 [Algoriphagus aquaeductus]
MAIFCVGIEKYDLRITIYEMMSGVEQLTKFKPLLDLRIEVHIHVVNLKSEI